MLLTKKVLAAALCLMLLCPTTVRALERSGPAYNALRIVAASSVCLWYVLYQYQEDVKKGSLSRLLRGLNILTLTADLLGD